jgi:hypothetical protein
MNGTADTDAASKLRILEESQAARKLGDDAANLFFGLAELKEIKAEVRSAAYAEKEERSVGLC